MIAVGVGGARRLRGLIRWVLSGWVVWFVSRARTRREAMTE